MVRDTAKASLNFQESRSIRHLCSAGRGVPVVRNWSSRGRFDGFQSASLAYSRMTLEIRVEIELPSSSTNTHPFQWCRIIRETTTSRSTHPRSPTPVFNFTYFTEARRASCARSFTPDGPPFRIDCFCQRLSRGDNGKIVIGFSAARKLAETNWDRGIFIMRPGN